jgi:hypothetical protein
MRRRTVLLGLATAVILLAGTFLGVLTAEEVDPVDLPSGWTRSGSGPVPEGVALPPSAVWKPISDDMSLLITDSPWGGRRATLYVRTADLWEAVALDGPTELLPRVLPAR